MKARWGFDMTMTRGQHLIGTTLGSCVLERLLGYGGSSAVYLAQQYTPFRKVAIKVFLPRSTMNAQMLREFYQRFLREAEAASQLDHPSILPVYSYGEQNGLPYIIMPYMPGGTLSEYITKHGPVSLDEACWYMEQMAGALTYAHAQGCVHCDVKPANMLLDGEGRLMLSDFGIARIHTLAAKEEQAATKSSETLMGTPDYISPEQALGESLDGRSDIYSLGISLFYMLAKELPFKADTTIALALLHVHQDPPSLALQRVDVTPTLDRVVRKALAKHADERFQTVGEFATAFVEAVAQAKQEQQAYSSEKPVVVIGVPEHVEQERVPHEVRFASQPVVRVKPSWRRTIAFPRVLIIALCLLVLVGASILASSVVAAHLFVGGMATTKTTIAATPAIGVGKVDRLTDHANWPTSSTFFFQQQQYHILNKSPQDVALALYANHEYSNFRLTVMMTEIHSLHQGADYYGVVFRSSLDQSHYYLFEVMTIGVEQYAFWRYDGQWETIATGDAPALHTNAAQGNMLTIDASASTFTFAINNQVVGKPVIDRDPSALTTGEIGLYVEEQGDEVAFSHLYIDALS